jgi:hypothetical protein
MGRIRTLAARLAVVVVVIVTMSIIGSMNTRVKEDARLGAPVLHAPSSFQKMDLQKNKIS